jgi:hypothetical protein
MAHLGDFGAALQELDPSAEKDSFSFFGEKFEVVNELPAVLVIQLGAFMTGKLNETEGMVAMWEALRISLDGDDLPEWTGEGPDTRPAPVRQFNQFYKLALDKRASVQSLTELLMSIFQAVGGERPTVQVPDLPAGQPATSPSSSTSASTPPVSGEVLEDRDPSVPHLVPVGRVLAG